MLKNFNYEDHVNLARGIYLRWNSDMAAAAVAWRRLFQNNCTRQDFEKLVMDSSHTSFCRGFCQELCK
jgi:hypothetical protein